VKCIKKSAIDKNPMLKKLLKTEVAVMNNINHPNIMHLFEFLESSNNYYLIMQYCNNGDLEGYLSKQPKNLINE
jgi:serine/threonine-protein kinase ULK/ATG1